MSASVGGAVQFPNTGLFNRETPAPGPVASGSGSGSEMAKVEVEASPAKVLSTPTVPSLSDEQFELYGLTCVPLSTLPFLRSSPD
jgi:hypothetical protein